MRLSHSLGDFHQQICSQVSFDPSRPFPEGEVNQARYYARAERQGKRHIVAQSRWDI